MKVRSVSAVVTAFRKCGDHDPFHKMVHVMWIGGPSVVGQFDCGGPS